MASGLITLGIGTPSSIGLLTLFGLTPVEEQPADQMLLVGEYVSMLPLEAEYEASLPLVGEYIASLPLTGEVE